MCRTEAASYQLRGLQGITLLVSVLMAGAVVPHSRALAANKTISDGVYSEAQGKEGEELYLLHCAECHGDRLRGLEYAPALRGADFLRIWNNKPPFRVRCQDPGNHAAATSRIPQQEASCRYCELLGLTRFRGHLTDLW